MGIKKNIKKFLASALTFTFFANVLPGNFIKVSAEETTTKVQILATTDLHGKFIPYEYARATKSDGGLTQIATLVKGLRTANPNTVLVDNGDTIQGNYNHLFTNNTFEGLNPMVLGIGEIGYDSFSFGNHEFNFGMDYLNKVSKQANDAGVKTLCANLYKDGKRVFDAYNIKTMPNGVKVATIGVVTPHINKWDGPNLVGYEPTNPTEEVAKVISEIKAAGGVDVYVVTAHMGLTSEYGNGDSCTEIATANPDVDVVVIGHSHSSDKGVTIGNALLIQPANSAVSLGKVEVELKKDANGQYQVVNKTSELIGTKDVAEDEDLKAKLSSYDEKAKADASTPIGKLVGSDLADANEIADIPESIVRDQGITDLVNEVQLFYMNKYLTDMNVNTKGGYMVSGAALFDAKSNMKAGYIKKSDVSNIYKYDNKLYVIKTNGKQLKKYMEWTATIYNTFNAGDLTVSLDQNIRLYQLDMLDGVKYDINLTKAPGNRIENLKFKADGKVVGEEDIVYLAVNNYRYDSKLNAVGSAIFDEGTHEKIYDTNNDILSDMRDLITEYIVNEKAGTVERHIDNNWRLTGFKYDEALRADVVKLVKEGKIIIPRSEDGRTPNVKSITVADVMEAKNLKRVEILSFNDFHGSIEENGKNIGMAKLGTLIKERTKLNPSENYEAITLSAGDLYQGSAMSNLTKGKPISEFLKAVGVKASALGNHEFDWERDLIKTWAKDGNLDFLAANIIDKATGKPVDWAKPYIIIEVDGVKIGVIGSTTPETAYKTKPENVKDLVFEDPQISVNKYAKQLKEVDKVNAVVVLSHLGATTEKDGTPVGEAVDLAKVVKNVDAIIASHDHRFTNVEVNGIKIIEAGYNGRGLGILTFDFDESGKLVKLNASIDEAYKRVKEIKADESILEIVNKYKAELKPLLEKEVTKLDKDLSHDRNDGLTPLGIVVSETMRKITGADIAITNGGGIRAPLSAGMLTMGDLYTILPFDNTLYTMTLKGSDVLAAIEHGIMPANMGWGQFSGIKVWYDEKADAGSRVTSIRLADGTKLDLNKEYKVVVNDFMATGGDAYDFSNATDMYDTNLVMRDEIVTYWQKNGIDTNIEKLLTAGEDTTIDEDKGNGNIDEGKDDNVTPGGSGNNSGKLPSTGGQNSAIILLIASMLTAAGYVMFRKKKEDEEKIS
ncbi:5'-nucleotidase C-terminal domain-containing protein [Clostridium sp.]|uniref:5'-nucleotidase C-terminal domain-containing protein n=1 Tax=Clostridium sp. TaxID=1506 RepID=UPI002625A21F|nr:5'-nucleotidase C-terminal domain-containing protein [Clostridium sp.]